MKRIKFKLKKLDYRHYICLFVILSLCVLIGFRYINSLPRLYESIRDFCTSLIYYFLSIFELENIEATVTNFSDYSPTISLPETWELFKAKFAFYWALFFSKNNFNAYLLYLSSIVFERLYIVILLLLPLVLLVSIFMYRLFNSQNNDYNNDSKPLRIYKSFYKKLVEPIISWVIGFREFLRKNSKYVLAVVILLLLAFNVISVVISAIAYVLYFVASFDFLSLYKQVLKLFADLTPAFRDIPLLIWIVVAFILINKFRQNIGFTVLRHNERKNCGFINERPIVFMVVGSMGKKKTTLVTDMCLSQEAMLRDKAFELMLSNDMKFPRFPWINFENCLKDAIKTHKVYNLSTCKKFIHTLYFYFCAVNSIDDKAVLKSIRRHYKRYYGCYYENYLFDYDYNTYGFYNNDNLKNVDIWSVLETYAQLYFIYLCQSSLLLSNFSIRTDNIFSDGGNLPLWDTDFFKRDSRYSDFYSRHSHILDFDSLRLGKKVVEENKLANSFEFGVIAITEIGKERRNNLELNEVKRKDTSANQKNDLFNSWLKMVRHSATVDNFPFVRVIVDEQRPESWGSDARDLCEIIHVDECSDIRLAMPFFAFGEIINAIVSRRFNSNYTKYRFNRGDNVFTMHAYKGIVAKFSHYYNRIYNQFGYFKVALNVEKGTQDGALKPYVYYLSTKKIYSKRFSTDCFSDLFFSKSALSDYGLNDIPEFATEKATVAEMFSENSYFFNDLCEVFRDYKIIN